MIKDSKKEIEENQMIEEAQERRYFDLIEAVGSKHKFQYIILIIAIFIFFYNGLTTYNVSYLFMNPEFDCSKQNLRGLECTQFVCKNPSEDYRASFPKIKLYETLATTFGPYYCENTISLAFYRSVQSIGAIVGIPFFIDYSDNKSRKNAILLCFSCMIVGFSILCLSINMLMACIGLFIVGLGNNITLKIIQVIISQVTSKKLIGGFFSCILFPFSLSALLVGPIFAITSEWRTFCIYFCLIPAVVIFFIIYIFCEDPPRHLLKKTPDEAYRALEHISKINNFQMNLTETDLQPYFQDEQKFELMKKNSSFFDIFKYRSLRVGSICFCVISCTVDFFYYSLSAMIDKIGFSPILNGYLIGFSQITILPFALIFSPHMRRKCSGITFFMILFIIGIILQIIQVPKCCLQCQLIYVQMGLVMISRGVLTFQNVVIFQHYAEFFPVSVRSIGYGIPLLCGCLGIFFSQFILVSLLQKFQKVFFVISIGAFLGLLAYCHIPETLNQPMKDHIEEVKEQVNGNQIYTS